jgi:glycosyltransferase involved in cell wall biosynthesis
MDKISISTITPVYRGADTLKELVSEIQLYRDFLLESKGPLSLTESIFVDDGSQDNSHEVLKEIANEYPWVKVITLSRNFGQHSATVAGILHSSGDWIVTLDEDLQHNPKYIHQMLKKAVSDQFDIVYANSVDSIHGSFFRDRSSKIIKSILGRITGNTSVPFFNSFRVIRGSIARVASAVSIDQTYFDVALSWFTLRVGVISIPLKDLRYIESKQSGYSIRSLFSQARKLIQSSNVKIVRIGLVLGFTVMIIGLAATVFILIEKLFHPELINSQGWTSLIITVLLLGGLNLFLVGLALENISVLMMQTHGKPKFFEVDRQSDKVLYDWFVNTNS